jgi:hypothetical protein
MIRYRLICGPTSDVAASATRRTSPGKAKAKGAAGRAKVVKPRAGCGYEFESWFQSSSAFDTLVGKGQVVCPACGSARIEKTLMAPSVKTTKGKNRSIALTPDPEAADVPAPPVAESRQLASLAPEQRAFIEAMRKMRDHVLAQSENVGKKFADEARKMHYEEADRRSIHGEASLEEAKALVEEGIEVFPIPELPDDRN